MDITEELERYAFGAMPNYPGDICSRAWREIEKLRNLLEVSEATNRAKSEMLVAITDETVDDINELRNMAREVLGWPAVLSPAERLEAVKDAKSSTGFGDGL